MIGNDIVDLCLASKESDWERRGFLDKIFSKEEQQLISKAVCPELMVWNLWSRKEAAYKIYNRISGVRGYFPLELQVAFHDDIRGTVSIKGLTFYTQTQISKDFVYTRAVENNSIWDCLRELDSLEFVEKDKGIPYLLNPITNSRRPVSITHHGRFQRAISVY